MLRYLMIVCVVVVLIGCAEEGTETQTPTLTPLITPTPEPSLTESIKQIQKEIKEKTTQVEVERVDYFGGKKHVNVWFVKKNVSNKEYLRNSFAYASFNIMGTLDNYSRIINSVRLIGKSNLNESQELEEVYRAEVDMDKARKIKWGNMTYTGKMALENTFDNVWWHPDLEPETST